VIEYLFQMEEDADDGGLETFEQVTMMFLLLLLLLLFVLLLALRLLILETFEQWFVCEVVRPMQKKRGWIIATVRMMPMLLLVQLLVPLRLLVLTSLLQFVEGNYNVLANGNNHLSAWRRARGPAAARWSEHKREQSSGGGGSEGGGGAAQRREEEEEEEDGEDEERTREGEGSGSPKASKHWSYGPLTSSSATSSTGHAASTLTEPGGSARPPAGATLQRTR